MFDSRDKNWTMFAEDDGTGVSDAGAEVSMVEEDANRMSETGMEDGKATWFTAESANDKEELVSG